MRVIGGLMTLVLSVLVEATNPLSFLVATLSHKFQRLKVLRIRRRFILERPSNLVSVLEDAATRFVIQDSNWVIN